MEAKEKATQLFDLYYQYCNNSIVRKHYAKECALIAVDEILLHEKNSHSVLDKATDYWQEVKEEINKL